MSLDDELAEVTKNKPLIASWVAQWVAKLPPKDKKIWDGWLRNPQMESASMYRVIRRHGFPHAQSSFRAWVATQRQGPQ
jgi:hypothetical protein